MRHILFLALASMTILLSSCSTKLTPFTQRMYDENQWSERDLSNIQFYLSHDVVLRRDAGGSESNITDGKIRVINGREVEEVVFKAGTPGVLVSIPKDNRFAISFEEGDDNFLIFGEGKKTSGRYVVLAKDWNRRVGKVKYHGKYYSIDTNSAYASLLVDIKKARKTIRKTESVGGRRINS